MRACLNIQEMNAAGQNIVHRSDHRNGVRRRVSVQAAKLLAQGRDAVFVSQR